MLRIGSTWITSKVNHHILRARWSPHVVRYCMEKYGWDHQIMDDVAWKQIGTALCRCSHTQRMQTSKIMHGWLPVMHMQAHSSGPAQCPLCPFPDETLDHIFHCPHPVLKCKRELILEELRKKGLKLDIPRVVVEALCGLLREYIWGEEVSHHDDPSLHAAVSAQRNIGLAMLPRGFISGTWITAMEAFGCSRPHHKLSSLIFNLLIELTDKLWRERNTLAHDRHSNLNDQALSHLLDVQLLWYAENYRHHISYRDYRLISDIQPGAIQGIPLRTKKQLLRHLDAAKRPSLWTACVCNHVLHSILLL